MHGNFSRKTGDKILTELIYLALKDAALHHTSWWGTDEQKGSLHQLIDVI